MSNEPVVLAIFAHPDDAEIRCFGTLCKYKEKGYKCINLIVCKGENGISLKDRDHMGVTYIPESIRLQESRYAFENTGIELEMLSFNDGSVLVGRELIVAIEEKIRCYQPEIIITHYPDDLCVDHQDHSNVGKATINCATRTEFVKKILLCEPIMTLRAGFIPNYYIEVTKFFDRKIQALLCHESQKGRYYLDSEYHNIKASYYAASVGFTVAQNNAKYEAFYLLYSVE